MHANRMRKLLVETAQLWPGHREIDFNHVELESIIRLIKDAAEADRNLIQQLYVKQGELTE